MKAIITKLRATGSNYGRWKTYVVSIPKDIGDGFKEGPIEIFMFNSDEELTIEIINKQREEAKKREEIRKVMKDAELHKIHRRKKHF